MNIYRSGWFIFCLFCTLGAGAQKMPAKTSPPSFVFAGGRSVENIARLRQTADDRPSARTSPPSFVIVPLGVRGGLDESNLSAYMVAPAGSNEYICLDAGTLYAGIRKAVDSGVFAATVSQVLRSYIKCYFISHPHLDHVAGLIINSPEDSAKTIYGLPFCLDVLKDKYFTWESWANFGDEGEKPVLKKYHYAPLSPGEEIAIPHTALYVSAYPLSHGTPYQSTAFLVRSGDAYLLYLGDTGADTIEHSDKLHLLWRRVAPLIRAGQLKAIFIEVSFPDEQPEKLLFGHLTPRLLRSALMNLTQTAGQPLAGLPVVITHRKPSGNQETMIQKELEADHSLPVKFIFPQQARPLSF
jgi:3',5'-cyclic-nucleotide phosphodiesterase